VVVSPTNHLLQSDKAQRELQAQLEMQTQAVESLKTEFAELNTHLTVVEAEKRELETSKDVAMHSVKFELETVRRDLQHAQSQSTESSRELSSYKARAHTLLKQKQDDDQTTTKADLDRKVATRESCFSHSIPLRSTTRTGGVHMPEDGISPSPTAPCSHRNS
jgi:chromosome segregation ATPase